MPYFAREEWKSKVEEYFRRRIRDKPYAEILDTNIIFVDNTRSGSWFWYPDTNVLKLRQLILADAQRDLAVSDPIPLRWLPFTQGLRSDAAEDAHAPVMTLEEIAHKANQLCGIEPEDVPAMLRFHHDLGLLLHYHRNPLLSDNVITKVQWLVKVTSALLHPLQTGHKEYEEHFRLLHDHGILLESLAVHIWSIRCPAEAVHLSTPKQRFFLFRLYESFSMLYNTGKTLDPQGGGEAASRAWLCPPLVRMVGEAVTSLSKPCSNQAAKSARPVIRESPRIYLVCRKGLHLLQTQFWQLVVECLCYFHKQESSSQLRVEGTRMPSLFYQSARLPCDAVFPGHHLCITYFEKGLELVVLREEAAVKTCRASGEVVPPLEDVCSKLLVFIEAKMEDLTGDGIAKPMLLRMGRCSCPRSREPCNEHGRDSCRSPGCLHFVDLSAIVPSCPYGEHPAQDEVAQIYPVWYKVRLNFALPIFVFSHIESPPLYHIVQLSKCIHWAGCDFSQSFHTCKISTIQIEREEMRMTTFW